MEGEINNFIMVWTSVLCCLCYCHTIDGLFPKPNLTRFLALFPIACVFLVLPLNLTTINLAGTTVFFIGWLGSFKIALFALGKGPLFSSPPLPFTTFIPLACLPIKLQQHKKRRNGPTNRVTKMIVFVLLLGVYRYNKYFHPKFVLFVFTIHIYLCLELMLVMIGMMVRALFRAELDPPFNDPYKSTSLQDFWGRRWNLMVTNILRPTIYDPVYSISARLLPEWLASSPAVIATFMVSGIMHELVFYNIGREKPSGEVFSFFTLHGVCLVVETGIKKAIKGKFRLPRIVSGPLAIGFVILTSFWLFFPPLMRNKGNIKGCTEPLAFIEFVVHHRLVSSNNLTCPFL